MNFKMLVCILAPFATNKLERTTGHYRLKEIRFDTKMMWKRMWQPRNKPRPVPTNESSPKGSPVGVGRSPLFTKQKWGSLIGCEMRFSCAQWKVRAGISLCFSGD